MKTRRATARSYARVGVFLAGVALVACVGGLAASPPPIRLVADGTPVDGFVGSYCWDGGAGGTICVDTVEPHFDGAVPLPAGDPIRLQLEEPLPKSLTLTLSEELFGEDLASETVPVAQTVDWSPQVGPGEYILSVHGSWRQGDVSTWFSIALGP